MNKALPKLVGVVLALTGCISYVPAKSSERETTLRACARLFGPTVDAHRNLFEISSLHVLQLEFDSQEKLIEMSLFPKHWLEQTHPEWKEPKTPAVLTKTEYEKLFASLEQVKPKGALIKSGTLGITPNSTTYFLDGYEGALVQRGEYGDRNTRFATLYFSREIKGKVKKKSLFKRSQRKYDYFQVAIGQLNYFVRERDYLRLKIGQVARFSAVGPVKFVCFENNCNP